MSIIDLYNMAGILEDWTQQVQFISHGQKSMRTNVYSLQQQFIQVKINMNRNYNFNDQSNHHEKGNLVDHNG